MKSEINTIIELAKVTNDIDTTKFIIVILLLLSLWLIPKLVLFILDRIKLKNDKEKEKSVKSEHDKFFRNANKTMQIFNTATDNLVNLNNKFQISPSSKKFIILIDSFLGVNKDFLALFKSKVYNYLENPKKESFVYVKEDIKSIFVERVINRLNFFVFENTKFSYIIEDECFNIINNFLNIIEDKIPTKSSEEIKQFIESDAGVYILITNLTNVLLRNYKEYMFTDNNIEYLLK
jgi:hypothetical protein